MQREKVANPPLTISDSVGVSSRAPRRINTLFWLFIFLSFHHLGPLERAQSFAKRNLPAASRPAEKQVAKDVAMKINTRR